MGRSARLENAPCTNPHQGRTTRKKSQSEKTRESLKGFWLPPRDSNPDMLIQSQLSCR